MRECFTWGEKFKLYQFHSSTRYEDLKGDTI